MKFQAYLQHVGRNLKAARPKNGLKQIDVQEGSGLTYRH
jgi:hypothetical protein